MKLSKKQSLYIFLSGLFLTNAIVAEIIGAKIFSVENTLGFQPVNIHLLGYTLDFNMSAGVLNWPFVFIISDLINEYFGKNGVRKISFLTAGFLVYAFILIYFSTLLKPAGFWLEVNKGVNVANDFDISVAYTTVLTQGMGIILGSLTAFLIGQLLDAYIFHRLRIITKNKQLWLRATGSTLFSQLIDSFVVLFIAFYLFGDWSFAQIVAVGSVNYIYKFVVALIMTPVIYIAHNFIDKYLGKDTATGMIEDATNAGF